MDRSLDLDDLDARTGRSRKKPQDDDLSGSGKRTPKDSQEEGLDNIGRHSRTSRQVRQRGKDDLDGPDMLEQLEKGKEPPRRTLSGDLDSSIVLGPADDKTWKHLDTVHKAKFSDFGDSMGDSTLMEDSFAGSSFAGSSFASGADSWQETEQMKASDQFTALDDEPQSPVGGLGSPGPRRMTPKRTYSRQKKTMPKKRDPLMAISEAEHDSLDS